MKHSSDCVGRPLPELCTVLYIKIELTIDMELYINEWFQKADGTCELCTVLYIKIELNIDMEK